MATTIYLVKRYKRARRANGRREYTWALRWEEGGQFRCEKTGTADKTQAEDLRKLKWAEVNRLVEPVAPPPPPAPPAPIKATWQECRDALERAMRTDNLRQSYISDALLVLDGLRKMFPGASSPGDISPSDANEWKRKRAEQTVDDNGGLLSPWTIRGDLSTLKAIFGKWLWRECGLVFSNPFQDVKPPKCDELEIRIVTQAESGAFLDWLAGEWNGWGLPEIYVRVAIALGWRATEIASMRADDVLSDGFVRVAAETSKTRRQKYGWLPDDLHAALKACAADGWAFGRFADDLRRHLMLWKKRPHIAARVQPYAPQRFVGWLQDQLQQFNEHAAAEAAERQERYEPFTLHDLRRTAITGLQMAGVSEKDASVMVGATPEVMRKHYEKLDQLVIAKRGGQLRMQSEAANSTSFARPLRAAETA